MSQFQWKLSWCLMLCIVSYLCVLVLMFLTLRREVLISVIFPWLNKGSIHIWNFTVFHFNDLILFSWLSQRFSLGHFNTSLNESMNRWNGFIKFFASNFSWIKISWSKWSVSNFWCTLVPSVPDGWLFALHNTLTAGNELWTEAKCY